VKLGVAKAMPLHCRKSNCSRVQVQSSNQSHIVDSGSVMPGIFELN